MGRPALFLDRDGVINVDHGYVHRQADFEFIPGIFELCREAMSLGFRLFVITNQAGIARGLFTEDNFHSLTRWMCDRFENEGVPINGVYFCPTHPTAGIGRYRIESEFRKPRPGMILKAATEHGLDLSQSVLIGDHLTDIQAGLAAGVGRNILLGQHGRKALPCESDGCSIVRDLFEARRLLVEGGPAAVP
jgi:D-glycero-D-manno-heptose 1,7-bisphosphate phosphatase